MHSPEQMRKKAQAMTESVHHHKHSAVDGKHHDMKREEMMYRKMRRETANNPEGYESAGYAI